MGKYFILFFSVFIFAKSFAADKNKLTNVSSPVVCYGSGETQKTFIERPVGLKNANGRTANIIVNYVGFSDEAKQAFQYAVDIWKELVYSPMPIHVQANWTSLSSSTLGSCSPSEMLRNFGGTETRNVYYPIAIAEKMAGRELNTESNYEIDARFNKDLPSWYFGTDGNCPAGKYDFVSVVLHEMGHGLGFFGNFYSSRGRGGYSYLSDNLPANFDTHVVNKDGNRLTNKILYPNPSIALNQHLISGWLGFKTDLLESEVPRLFAPSSWDLGSSVYHLDEDIYQPGTANSLMTPIANAAEAVHNPGPNTLAILYDIGWKSVTVFHKKLNDREPSENPIVVNAKILADNGLDLNSVYLVYSGNNFISKDSVRFTSVSAFDDYLATLNLFKNGTYQYYISLKDLKNRRYIYPSNGLSGAMSFKIGIDAEDPVVSYKRLSYMMDTNPGVKMVASVTDNLGVKSVQLEYFLNGGLKKSIELKNDSNDVFSAELEFELGSVKDGDVVSYRVVATDASASSNTGRYPLSGYDTFRVEGFRNPVSLYMNSFDSQPNDFISNDFDVSTPTGFISSALNSQHPYKSPEVDDSTLNFVSILKYPLILSGGSRMNFDEIVLVEPGDAGTKFGDENFYDYVIVEGSKDGGKIWLPLIDGYDCTAQNSWNSLYNSAINDQNSTATPTRDLYVNRDFSLLSSGNFAAGDTILVRFRLFSDPYANGWGWVVDNLRVYNDGTLAPAIVQSPGEVMLYPNPAKETVTLDIQSRKIIDSLFLRVFNSSGLMVLNRSLSAGSGAIRSTIDVKNLAPGIYLFVIEAGNRKPEYRKILIQ